jgi:hypothetical protein
MRWYLLSAIASGDALESATSDGQANAQAELPAADSVNRSLLFVRVKQESMTALLRIRLDNFITF